MERYTLNASIRTAKGRKVRREKLVPAVLYGRKVQARNIAVPESELNHFINHGSPNALINLAVGGESYTVMLKELQRDRIKGNVIHADFYSVDLSQKITVTVPIHLVGEAPAVKEGGVLQLQTREVEIKCLPTEIPQSFDLDISALQIGDTRTVADLSVTGDIEMLTPADEVIVAVLAPRLADEVETETTEAEETTATSEEAEEGAE